MMGMKGLFVLSIFIAQTVRVFISSFSPFLFSLLLSDSNKLKQELTSLKSNICNRKSSPLYYIIAVCYMSKICTL